ncbi:aquaporin [Rhizobium leguminosarum]|uniref:aquaporin n=1 Tax=Rhizobium TaxID=379 RepID=UPI00037E4EC8|nr:MULTISPECIES: aquaporin [Rhizobium]MCA2431056.1 aquaporin [Rhizobium leguminosarum]NEH83005.1 MIP family protein [Rhizobium ruizarguesonis]NKK09186.1 MIP family protein [Rhizobium leguminosarum bv. viciae]TAY13791.1 MIP family protein [Rhizobium leguminosarum]TAY27747.1 MIP family protein [Rhizobium leguminosarum]
MAETSLSADVRCFFERDPALSLFRRAFVESVGTGLLAIAMVGSGLAVSTYAKAQPLAASLVIAIAIAGSLVGLIVALGKVSGGHYNPLITFAQWLGGERKGDCTIGYVIAQIIGGVVGALVAGQMFGSPFRTVSPEFPSFGMLLSELVASAGLMTVVFGCARSSRWDTGPFAVGSWLVAAILATPSTSYANPAVTLAAAFASGPVALAPVTAVAFVAAQVMGMVVAIGINRIAFGSTTEPAGNAALAGSSQEKLT